MFGSLDRCLRSLSRRFTTPPPLPRRTDPHLRSPASTRPEQDSRAPLLSGRYRHRQRDRPRLRGSARGILVGMNLAGPSGTNKQLPTTPPPPQPLLSSVKPQKREEGKRKNPKCFLFPQLFHSVSVLCWVVCRNKSSRPGLGFFQPS